MGETTDAIDREVYDALLSSVGGDQEFLAELVGAYLEDSSRLLADLRTALAAGNADTFRRAAHDLKSTSANLGAMALSRIGRMLEEKGKSGVLDDAGKGIAQAEAEHARVENTLKALSASTEQG